jgi:predicted CoA-binding protein
MDDEEKIKKVLKESTTIAVVGCSRDPEKAANYVPQYLKENNYTIIPVNPFADEILGEKTVRTLAELKGMQIDVVDVFRPSSEAYEIAKAASEINAKCIWLQEGIRSKEAKEFAEKNGIIFIQDKCMMKEHMKMKREER